MFPFKFKPEFNFVNIGSEKSGIIELLQYDDLTIAEQIEYEQKVKELGSETKPVVELITAISKEEAIGFEFAQGILFGEKALKLPNNKEPNSIRMKYSDRILEMNSRLLPIQQGKQLIGATLMVKRAVKPLEVYLESLQAKLKTAKNEEKQSLTEEITEYQIQIEKLKKWTIEDSKTTFLQSMLKALYEFFLQESNGGKMPETVEVAEDIVAEKNNMTIDTMGKHVADAAEEPTGQKSITESKTSSPEKKDSVTTPLPKTPVAL